MTYQSFFEQINLLHGVLVLGATLVLDKLKFSSPRCCYFVIGFPNMAVDCEFSSSIGFTTVKKTVCLLCSPSFPFVIKPDAMIEWKPWEEPTWKTCGANPSFNTTRSCNVGSIFCPECLYVAHIWNKFSVTIREIFNSLRINATFVVPSFKSTLDSWSLYFSFNLPHCMVPSAPRR